MTAEISYPGLAGALLLPWVLGAAGMALLLRNSPRCNILLIIGQGYLAGIVLTTVVMQMWSALGLPLVPVLLQSALALICLVLIGVLVRTRGNGRQPTSRELPLVGWEICTIVLLLLLTGLRFSVVLQEIVLRPLFPWDALMNWAPKAITWFHYGELVPYADTETWLRGDNPPLTQTLRAANYPQLVPLVQLWNMLGIGSSDHTLIYLSWPLLTLNLGLALYGHLRLYYSSPLVPVLACYLLLNLPYVNVHTALAGYADIWLTSAFALAVFCAQWWQHQRDRRFLMLALFFAFACIQIKNPGLVLAGIVLVTLVASALPIRWQTWSTLGSGALIIVAVALMLGIDVQIPYLGKLYVGTERLELPLLGEYSLAFHPVQGAFLRTLAQSLNWNGLFVVALPLALLLMTGRRRSISPPSITLMNLLLCSAFLLFIFFLTRYNRFALDLTLLNRTLLYLVPLLIYFIAISLLPTQSQSRDHQQRDQPE